MDENFLLQKKRAMELLALHAGGGKELGLPHLLVGERDPEVHATRNWCNSASRPSGWGWSRRARLTPSWTAPTRCKLARELRQHGIVLLGSTIIGLEHHTPENIGEEIEHAISHGTDLHQFMLYTPVPGTPLYREMEEQGRLLDVDLADIHGQLGFNFQHAAISREQSKRVPGFGIPAGFRAQRSEPLPDLPHEFRGLEAAQESSGPAGPRARSIGRRRLLRHAYAAMLWAMEHRLNRTNHTVALQIRTLRKEMEREFGLIATAASPITRARSSGGRAGARSGGWRAASSTSPPQSSAGETGWKGRGHRPDRVTLLVLAVARVESGPGT